MATTTPEDPGAIDLDIFKRQRPEDLSVDIKALIAAVVALRERVVELQDGWEPTGELRWVKRMHPHGGYDMLLEQLWVWPPTARHGGDFDAEPLTAWHEVPTVEE